MGVLSVLSPCVSDDAVLSSEVGYLSLTAQTFTYLVQEKHILTKRATKTLNLIASAKKTSLKTRKSLTQRRVFGRRRLVMQLMDFKNNAKFDWLVNWLPVVSTNRINR